MKERTVMHDERTDAVVGMGCRIAFLVLSFGVLIIAVVRTWLFRQQCWDLMGLYIVGNLVGLIYQHAHRAQVIPWRWMVLFGLAGAVFGVAMSLLR